MKNYLLVTLLLICSTQSKAQITNENWIPISSSEGTILCINITGISAYKGDEIFIWSLQELNPPMTMEEVNGDIYKVKTYYLINKQLRRYSIQQIIFYDNKNNVLKNYDYENKYEKPEFKFSYPIIRDSDVDKILSKVLDVIQSNNNEK